MSTIYNFEKYLSKVFKVPKLINELKDYGANVLVHDPLADPQEARDFYGLQLIKMEEIQDIDAVIVAVSHQYYKDQGFQNIVNLCDSDKPILIDIIGAFSSQMKQEADTSSITYWRL